MKPCPRCGKEVEDRAGYQEPYDSTCPYCKGHIYCSFCYGLVIEIIPGEYACPNIEGSGLHFGMVGCCAEENERWLREERFEKAKFTLEEYREAVKAWR